MIDQLSKYILKNKLCESSDKILIALSGGADSIVLMHLLIELGYQTGAVHINHKMRGLDSEEDTFFCKSLCEKLIIPLYIVDLPDEIKNSGDFQEKARTFRYSTFNKILYEHGYDKIATAHHSDDAAETFLINVGRASGLKGLIGIPEINQNVIRPLLDFNKSQILNYIRTHNLEFREDQSNSESKYYRNFIRNEIIPRWNSYSQQKLDIPNSINKTISHLKEADTIIDELISQSGLIHKENTDVWIDKKVLNKYTNKEAILYFILNHYHFNRYQVEDILSSTMNGSRIESKSHVCVNDREKFVVSISDKDTSSECIEIRSPGTYLFNNYALSFRFCKADDDKSEQCQYLFFSEDPFPLHVRTKLAGDQIRPLRLKGKTQKVKKLLTDDKVEFITKRDLMVILKNDVIVSLFNHTIAFGYEYQNGRNIIIEIKRNRNNN